MFQSWITRDKNSKTWNEAKLFSQVLKVLAREVRQEKPNKAEWKKKITFICRQYNHIFKWPKDCSRKHLVLIRTFTGVARYITNTRKLSAFLYSTNKSGKRGKELANFIYDFSKTNIKYFRISVTKAVRDLYYTNFKTLKELRKMQKDEKTFTIMDGHNLL